MQLFSTRLCVTKDLTVERFAELFVRWNQGSPHPENHIPEFIWNGQTQGRWGDANVWAEFRYFVEKDTFAARFQKMDDDGSVWDTDFVLLPSEQQLYVQLHRSFVDESALIQRSFSTPAIIGMLADEGYLACDGDLPVLKSYQIVGADDTEMMERIITGKKIYDLPIVYITKPMRGDHRVQYSEIAKRLKGVAHVLVEENTLLSVKLREMCDDENEHNGQIGVYYPNGLEEHRVFQTQYNPKGVTEKLCRSLIMYANALYVDPLCTFDGVCSAMKDAEIQELHAKNESDVQEIFDAYAHEVSMLKDQVKKLSDDLYAKDMELTGLRRQREDREGIPLIMYGEEDEYFEGEFVEMVLEALAAYVDSHADKSRRSVVLRDVMSANAREGASELKARAEQMEKIFTGYRRLTDTMEAELRRMGVDVDSVNHHYKLLYNGDTRYPVTISRTPSDVRAGMNTAKKIAREWF